MIKNEFFDGILYQIEYKPELSNGDYTQHRVYYIKTEDDNYPHAHKAIESIMNDGSWRKGYKKMKVKENLSIENTFHSYHEFEYNCDEDCYVYTLVIPYDD